ncbi:hypothetical protein FD06_GL000801 [Apilactobacillus ozensis DSM 23829 = JCM 17196]|uniref:DUF4260 domain-containing protein n=2 Tax=Apilactobacillus ozensis TaxID=866801 RepID=A0A0R2AKC9_9LACO|nr:hypothetical protein FD06_GL000801 [Apilactobacillus ozensis DSM 23829 = JCM 17196]
MYFYEFKFSLIWLIILILIPDISAVGYLFNNKLGAYTYNLMHSLVLPTMFLIITIFLHYHVNTFLIIWFIHIFMDRSLGYGLKYNDNFQHTHIDSMKKD